MFSITTTLLFADQNLMAPNLTEIAKEYGFNDEERDKKLGGQIALAFFVLGAPASYIVGCLGDSDSLSRSALFAATVGVGEGACMLTYFSTTYRGLFICRAVTGFSLGGAVPLIYSVLGDLFAAEDRHAVNAFVGIGTGLGISVGQGVAGFLGPTYGWRLPFLVISIPALFCALLVLLFVEDPIRGGTEKALQPYQDEMPDNNQEQDRVNNSIEIVPLDRSSHSLRTADQHDRICSEELVVTKSFHFRESWATLMELVSTPSVLLALLQGAPGCIPWGIVNAFLNDFLSQDRGMTVEVRRLCL
jgi:MFS family permease